MTEEEAWDLFVKDPTMDIDPLWERYKQAAWERKWWQKYITDWIPRVKVDLTVRVWMPVSSESRARKIDRRQNPYLFRGV